VDSYDSGYGPMAASCEHGNVTSGSIKGWGEFLTGQLSDCHEGSCCVEFGNSSFSHTLLRI